MSVQGSAATRASEKRPDEAAIRAQLECIVGSTAFRNSKRYTSLLRHLVERTLEGRDAELKERRLGSEVFHRPPDYDPNSDPIVRTSAGELRRRIAQYYHEAANESELRIDLPVGSYVPEFRQPKIDPSAFEPVVTLGTVNPWRRSIRIGIAAALLVAVAGLVAWRLWDRPNDLTRFWQPVLGSKADVSLCVALLGYAEDADQTVRAARPQMVGVPDVKTITRIAGLLDAKQQPFRLQVDDRTTLDELRGAPAILVGAFNDIWTMRLMDDLRFRFRRDGSSFWIEDQQNPASRKWGVDLSRSDSNGRRQPTRDYAVISRILTAKTGQPVIAVAGAFGPGTEIAGECVTNPAFFATIAKQAPRNWEKMNAQIVISTDIIGGQPGPATVVATHFWR